MLGAQASFRYETDLCGALSARLAAFASAETRVIPQLQVGPNIPDFVITRVPRTPQAPRVNTMESAVLAVLLHGPPRRKDRIASQLFSQPARVSSALERLCRLGLAIEISPSRFTVSKSAFEGASVIAIEAKLRRWREAVEQAVSYLRFSNLAFVALPVAVIQARGPELRAECSRRRIGVLGVDSERIRVELPAVGHEPRSADWVWTVLRSRADLSVTLEKSEKPTTNCVDVSGLSVG